MSERKYTVWFAKRRESNVLDGVKEHILKVLDTCEEMDNTIAAIMDGDEESARHAIERLYNNEKAADNIEVQLNENLAVGDLEPKDRVDLMHLVKNVDRIANWVKTAARNIEVIIEASIDVPGKVWKNIQLLSRRVTEVANEVKLCMDYLGEDNDRFIKHQRNVDRIEHEIDDLYFAVKKNVMLSMSLDPRVMFVMRDIIHSLENAADNCKNSADLMHIIMTASK